MDVKFSEIKFNIVRRTTNYSFVISEIFNLCTIPCCFYGPPNAENWMYELCTFSQIRSQLLTLSI